MGDKQGRAGSLRHFLAKQVGKPVLQPQRRKTGIAHPFKQAARIGPASVGNGNQQRQCRGLRVHQGIGRRAPAARYHAALLTVRIICTALLWFHPPRLACLQFCVKVGQGQF